MKKLLKTAAWVAAPKAMFVAKNPRKAALLKAAGWAAGHMGLQRKRRSTGMTTAKGLAAAAVALPVGLWLGNRFRGSTESANA